MRTELKQLGHGDLHPPNVPHLREAVESTMPPTLSLVDMQGEEREEGNAPRIQTKAASMDSGFGFGVDKI